MSRLKNEQTCENAVTVILDEGLYTTPYWSACSGVARGGQVGASAPGRQGLGRQNED